MAGPQQGSGYVLCFRPGGNTATHHQPGTGLEIRWRFQRANSQLSIFIAWQAAHHIGKRNLGHGYRLLLVAPVHASTTTEHPKQAQQHNTPHVFPRLSVFLRFVSVLQNCRYFLSSVPQRKRQNVMDNNSWER